MADDNKVVGVVIGAIFSKAAPLIVGGLLSALFGLATYVFSGVTSSVDKAVALGYSNSSQLGVVITKLDDHARRLDMIEKKLP